MLDRRKSPLSEIDIYVRRQGTVDFRLIGGSPSSRLIHHVDGVACSQKKLRPPFAAIGRPGEIASRLAATVNHNDRVGVSHLAWDLKLGVQLAVNHLFAFVVGILTYGRPVA